MDFEQTIKTQNLEETINREECETNILKFLG